MPLVEISVPAEVPKSIVFLNARLAITFISATFGTTKLVRRMSVFEGQNIMITDMIFMATMVLWKLEDET